MLLLPVPAGARNGQGLWGDGDWSLPRRAGGARACRTWRAAAPREWPGRYISLVDTSWCEVGGTSTTPHRLVGSAHIGHKRVPCPSVVRNAMLQDHARTHAIVTPYRRVSFDLPGESKQDHSFRWRAEFGSTTTSTKPFFCSGSILILRAAIATRLKVLIPVPLQIEIRCQQPVFTYLFFLKHSINTDTYIYMNTHNVRTLTTITPYIYEQL
jgi:hypothetical protein